MPTILHQAKVWTREVSLISKITTDRQRLIATTRANLKHVNRCFNSVKLWIVLKSDVLFPQSQSQCGIFQKNLSNLQTFMQMWCWIHWSYYSDITYTKKPVYSLEYPHKCFWLYCSAEQSKSINRHCSSPIGQSHIGRLSLQSSRIQIMNFSYQDWCLAYI